MKGKVVRIFLNADFRCQHEGLRLVAKKHKVSVDKLKSGEHVVFINSARNKIKMFSSDNVLSYYRLPKGKVDLHALQAIPLAFSGDLELAYDKALTKTVKQKLRIG